MTSHPNKPRAKDIKIIIVGPSGSGKTSLCQRWIKNEFTEDYKATIMTDFAHKVYEYQGNCYKVQLWDLAGQDKNIHATKILTKGSHGCLILSDVTQEKSLNDTVKWKKAIDETKFVDEDILPVILVHNKIDLLKENDLPNQDKMKEFVDSHQFLNYFQTSVKKGENVNECMNFLIEHIIQRLIEHAKNTNTPMTEDRKSIVVQNPREKEALMKIEERSGCC